MAATATELLDLLCADADDPRPLPHTVVVIAHPDDETVGAGARLPRLREASFIYMTDGAPLDEQDARANGFSSRAAYAAARRRERAAAFEIAGIDSARVRELGFVDQQCAGNLVPLTRMLEDLLNELRPEIVLTQPYEGGHPDHDATAFAVHAAVQQLPAADAPAVLEMTAYHQGPAGITPAEFLPFQEGITEACAEHAVVRTIQLTARQHALKERLFACYVTQAGTLRYMRTDVERFRVAPHYDFARPPHAGRLFYEHFAWGMTGARFRQLASEALDILASRSLR